MKKILLLFLIIHCNHLYPQISNPIISKTLEKIDSLTCLSYTSIITASAPGDTLDFNSFNIFTRFKNDKKDTLVGAKFINYTSDSSIYPRLVYQNNIIISFNWENKIARVDTINTENKHWMFPFFINVKSLLTYASKDETAKIVVEDKKDSICIHIMFKNQLTEFSFQPYVYKKENSNSIYTLWLNKQLLPYKLIRKMPHQTTTEKIKYISMNDYSDFENAINKSFIPENFTIKDYNGITINTKEIEGQKAWDWTLKDYDNNVIKLSDFKNKNLLIQFTGIGCGPCHLSIPMMKYLKENIKKNDIEIISIETNSQNLEGIKRYSEKNQLNYRVLIANNDLKKNYKITAVPMFIIINKLGFIEKVFIGYQKDITDEEISTYISHMKLKEKRYE